MPSTPLRPTCLFEVLDRHRVDYVLVGGLGAWLHGSPAMTVDADILPDMGDENLGRISACLRDLEARLRSPRDPEGVPFDPHPDLLRQMSALTMHTRCGDLDLCIKPAALGDYEEVNARSVGILVKGIEVRVAALDDIIRSKEAADRPKDHATLPILYALRDEIEKDQS